MSTLPEIPPSTRLDNGYTVLEAVAVSDAEYVILAVGCRQFATWRATSPSNCYWGHYHWTLKPALTDFANRLPASMREGYRS